MDHVPLVSVVSAFYNTGPLILDMIRSILAQTWTDWELVLINDGSTDDTLTLAQSVDDPRIRIFSNDRNRGRAFSLNRGTREARGKYIARMDSDDICSPTRLEKEVRLLESNPALDAVSTGVIYLDKNDNPVGDMVCPTEHEVICATPWRTIHLIHGAMMAKKEYFLKTPYREDIPIAIDFNMFFRSHHYSRFGNVPEPLYYYRLDGSFNLKKQYASRRVAANFLFEYYYNHNQMLKGLRYAAAQYIKFGITLLCFLTGLRAKLMANRFKPLSEAKRAAYRQEIQIIKSLDIPIKMNADARVENG